MAIYRSIPLKFWQDRKVSDEFNADDRFIFLYLLTNPHTNTCGCYEISAKQISRDTGLAQKRVDKALQRLWQEHRVIMFDSDNEEVLIRNWHKYNWNSSKVATAVRNQAKDIKNNSFRDYVLDTLSIQYPYGIDTTDTVTDTDTVPCL